MSVYDQYNSLFHRCVNKDNNPRTIEEVYNSPSPAFLFDKDSLENPLFGVVKPFYDDGNSSTKNHIIEFGTYNNTPIQWRILGNNAKYKGLVLISENILFTHRFDEDTNIWKDSELRQYLNTDFFNPSFTEEEKSKIRTVNTDKNVYDKVFLLSSQSRDFFCYQLYPSLGYNDIRKAKYNNNFGSWWLRSPVFNASFTASVSTVGDINGNIVYNTIIGVRPVIVVDDTIGCFKGIPNDLFSTVLWSRQSVQVENTFKVNNLLTVSDPLSPHNIAYRGLEREYVYSKVKNDAALFNYSSYSGNISITFHYVFRGTTETYTGFTDLPEGIYITPQNVFIKEKENFYSIGYTQKTSSLEEVFLSRFVEVGNLSTTFPEKAVYFSCWSDLDPRLELYLPVFHKKMFTADRDIKDHRNSIYWLGNYEWDPQIFSLLEDLCVSRGEVFI